MNRFHILVLLSLLLIQLASSQIFSNGFRNFGNSPNSAFSQANAKSLKGNGLPPPRNFGAPPMIRKENLESSLIAGLIDNNNPEEVAINLARPELFASIADVNLAGPNLANGVNRNGAKFNLANNGKPFSLGRQGNEGFALQIVANALEIGGNIGVSGKMPIYGSVAVDGHVPSDGIATVHYTCGGMQTQS